MVRAVRRRYNESMLVREFNEMERLREKEAKEAFYSAAPMNPLIAQHREFYATLPILGFFFWFKISNLPVELSRHTQIGSTMTAFAMSRMM